MLTSVSLLSRIDAFNSLVLRIERCFQVSACRYGFAEVFDVVLSSADVVGGHWMPGLVVAHVTVRYALVQRERVLGST